MTTLSHVGHAVLDIAVSQRFYTELLGFTFDRDLRLGPDALDELLRLEPSSHMHAAYLTLGGFTLELLQWDPASRPDAGSRVFNQTGLTHLSFVVDDPHAIAARAPRFGGTAVSAIKNATVIRDPDGQLIELISANAFAEL